MKIGETDINHNISDWHDFAKAEGMLPLNSHLRSIKLIQDTYRHRTGGGGKGEVSLAELLSVEKLPPPTP